MYIGVNLSERMKQFGLSIEALAEASLVKESIIADLMHDKLSLEEIRPLELDFLASVLYCDAEYFKDAAIREKDIVNVSLNRGTDTSKSNGVKAKLQSLVKDLMYVNSILAE